MPDLTRRERRLLQAVTAICLLVLAAVVATKVKRRLFPKEPARVIPLPEGVESGVLPRRPPPPVRSGALRTSMETMTVSGATRRYLVVAPTAPEPGRAYPVVLVLHGDGGGAASFHEGFPFEVASGDRAILAYPEGRPTGWDLETKIGNVDVTFLEAVVDALAARFTVDRSRVYAAGYSRGGFFANVLACQRSGFLRALSSSAGGAPYGQALVFANGFSRCPGQEATPVLALHGDLDFGVTLDSGRFTAEYWAYVNGCATSEMDTTGYDECTVYRGCPAGKAVGWCAVPGLGHWVWDRAAEASWTFFRTQSGDSVPR